MSKKRMAVWIAVILFGILSNVLIFQFIQPDAEAGYKFIFTIEADQEQVYQLYYRSAQTIDWDAVYSEQTEYKSPGKEKTFTFYLPQEATYLRFDFGTEPGVHTLSDVKIGSGWDTVSLDPQRMLTGTQTFMLDTLEVRDGAIYAATNGNDSSFTFDLTAIDLQNLIVEGQRTPVLLANIGRCILLDLTLLVMMLCFRPFKELAVHILGNRKLLMNLAKNDFKTKYAGSYLGIIWAFIQPIVTVLVYWFVFEVGFRSGAVMEVPWVLWLIAGIVPWFFFSDALNGGTTSLIEYSYLVKKVVFQIDILPIVKIISALFVHIFFVAFTIFMYVINGIYPTVYALQVIYYSLCLFIFVLGLTYVTSAVIVFFRDLGQIINILLQVGIWMTPIMWQETMMGEGTRWILKVNPIYYIVNGYRESLINHVWFWENPTQLIYFWFVTVCIFALGIVMFRRLKVHFADVL